MPLVRPTFEQIAALNASGALDHILPDLRPLVVATSQLAFDPANARGHDEKNLRSVKGSLLLYGQRVVLVVNTRNCVVEKGNGTLEVFQSLRWEYVAVAGADDDAVTAVGFAIVDNRASELAHWLPERLGPQLESLQQMDVDLSQLGFDALDLDGALRNLRDLDVSGSSEGDEEGDGGSDNESDGERLLCAGVTMEPPRHLTATGQVWQLGPHTLVCACVLTGHALYVPFLQEQSVFAPYPGPFLPLTQEAAARPFVLVQPDTFIAGHILDQWDNVFGEGHAKRISS